MREASALGKQLATFADFAIDLDKWSPENFQEFQALLSEYRRSTSGHQRSAREAITPAHAPALWVLAIAFAKRAYAERSSDRIVDGLTVLAIEDFRVDPRDSRLPLILLLWVDSHLGYEAAAWRAQIAMFSDTGARYLLEFLDGPRFAQALKTAELVAVEADGQVEFVPAVRRQPRRRTS